MGASPAIDEFFDTTRFEYGSLVDLRGRYSNLTGQLERLEELKAALRRPDVEERSTGPGTANTTSCEPAPDVSRTAR